MGHTIGAIAISVIVFFVLIYYAAPVAESILNVFGRLFLPERFGGGYEVDNPGMITLAIRAIIVSGVYAAGGLMTGFKLFGEAHHRSVAVIFSISVLTWAGFIAYLGLTSGEIFLPLMVFVLNSVPPLIFSYSAWQGDL